MAGQYDEAEIMKAFVDTLIPADSTPSASQLSLNKTLLEHSEKVVNYPQLISLGCDWLHNQAMQTKGKPFTELNEQFKKTIVRSADASPASTIQKQFFDRVRHDLFGLYYAEPASWDGISFDRPPQPHGYPEHVQEPKKVTT